MVKPVRPLLLKPVQPLVVPGVASIFGTGAVSGPYPPPAGYRWDYVVSGSEMVVSNNEPVVTLVRIN